MAFLLWNPGSALVAVGGVALFLACTPAAGFAALLRWALSCGAHGCVVWVCGPEMMLCVRLHFLGSFAFLLLSTVLGPVGTVGAGRESAAGPSTALVAQRTSAAPHRSTIAPARRPDASRWESMGGRDPYVARKLDAPLFGRQPQRGGFSMRTPKNLPLRKFVSPTVC